MKIKDYPAQTSAKPSDILIIDGVNGTKKITVSDLADILSSYAGLGGRDLGSTLSPAQLAFIKDGSFTGMLVGDYWLNNGIKWTIVDINYYKGFGSASSHVTQNHLVIMPDRGLGTVTPYSGQFITSGFIGSNLNNAAMDVYADMWKSIFGIDNVIAFNDQYSSKIAASGVVETMEWIIKSYSLPTETQLFGVSMVEAATMLSNGQSTIGNTQFKLFRENRELIVDANNYRYWLRGNALKVDTIYKWAFVDQYGLPGSANSTANTVYVRPYFLIG